MQRHRGFTLVEAIMAIAITGILTAIIANFMAGPITGYVSAARRADLTDSADLALRRMAMELRSAVPNTMRVGSGYYVEFIPAKSVGRYCTDTDSCSHSAIVFNENNTTISSIEFDVRGRMPEVTTGDQLIIFNTGQSRMNAYSGASDNNCATITGATTNTISYTKRPFAYASPTNHFFVAPVSGPVRFSCTTSQVQRIAGSAAFCGLTPTSSTAVLAGADSVACAFTYDASNGVLSVQLSLTTAGETVSLMHQIHVDNQS